VVVGRSHELGVLRDALTAARDGRGGAVLLVGERGIGKSWLATAAARVAEADGVRVLRGRGSVVGPPVPLRALTEALLSLPRAATDLDVTALGSYGRVLARLVPDWGATRAHDGGESPVLLAESVLRLLALVGRDLGCLLVLDDLQDDDAETLAVVEYLVDNLARQPVLLLVTVRDSPGPVLDMARSAGRRQAATVLGLARFDRPALRRFAASWLAMPAGDVPDPAVELLWAGSAGNASVAGELLAGFVGGGYLYRGDAGWAVADRMPAPVRAVFARSVAGRIAQLEPAARGVLSMCAVLGPRFGLAVLRDVTGLEHHDMLAHLHRDPVAELLGPDRQTPGWYAFRHPATGEALVSLLVPAARTALARLAADAVEAIHPGLPGEWCRRAAELRFDADEPAVAGRLFAESGRRALGRGAAHAAVPDLERAWELLAGDAAARLEVLETRLHALAEAGLVDRALADPRVVDEVTTSADPVGRARLHTLLASVACLDGRVTEVRKHVEIARTLLGPDAPAEATTRLDVVAAHLDLDAPGERLAQVARDLRRSAAAAEAVPLAAVACQAWQLLAEVTAATDPDGATDCLNRGWSVAARHDLPISEIHAMVRLGVDDALRDGDSRRLELARDTAVLAGAVTARYRAEVGLALQLVLRGEFGPADVLVDEVLAATTRLKLLETTRQMLLRRAVAAAHRGRRQEMESALTDLRRWQGGSPRYAPAAHGLAAAFCALLEEDRGLAGAELARAAAAAEAAPAAGGLAGHRGLGVLLAALSGGRPAATTARLRWDHQFVLLGRAVVLGRDGRAEEATAAVAEALDAGAPYAPARHLSLRLVGEAALADGWGTPVEWLRAAEVYFHDLDVLPVAGACRALLRRAGSWVGQRRCGVEHIPASLRGTGVTSREFEVLRLLRERLGNREIAEVLHLSQRTVEKHVSNLIAKTGMPNRVALSKFAAATAAR
jgi:DNA-binding CsgD family transcriptional regulator